jgi:hypothetical protein
MPVEESAAGTYKILVLRKATACSLDRYPIYRLAFHGLSWHPTAKGICRTQKRSAPNPRGSQQGPGKCGFTAVSQGHAQKRKQWVTRAAGGIPNVSPLGSSRCASHGISPLALTYLTSPAGSF